MNVVPFAMRWYIFIFLCNMYEHSFSFAYAVRILKSAHIKFQLDMSWADGIPSKCLWNRKIKKRKTVFAKRKIQIKMFSVSTLCRLSKIHEKCVLCETIISRVIINQSLCSSDADTKPYLLFYVIFSCSLWSQKYELINIYFASLLLLFFASCRSITYKVHLIY